MTKTKKKNKGKKAKNTLFFSKFEGTICLYFYIKSTMSAYKFTSKKAETPVSWSADKKSDSYLPPGQRKQTVEEAFPELQARVEVKRSSLNFADKLKAEAETKKPVQKSVEHVNVIAVPKNRVISDYDLWQSRRLYPSSEEETDTNAIVEEPEDEYDSYEELSEADDNVEVYDPSEYDRHGNKM